MLNQHDPPNVAPRAGGLLASLPGGAASVGDSLSLSPPPPPPESRYCHYCTTVIQRIPQSPPPRRSHGSFKAPAPLSRPARPARRLRTFREGSPTYMEGAGRCESQFPEPSIKRFSDVARWPSPALLRMHLHRDRRPRQVPRTGCNTPAPIGGRGGTPSDTVE